MATTEELIAREKALASGTAVGVRRELRGAPTTLRFSTSKGLA